MRSEIHGGASGNLYEIAKRGGNADAPFRIDQVMIIATKHGSNPTLTHFIPLLAGYRPSVDAMSTANNVFIFQAARAENGAAKPISAVVSPRQRKCESIGKP